MNLSNVDIIRAWKDEQYRNSLSEEIKAHLPASPVGYAKLTENVQPAEAAESDDGTTSWICTWGCSPISVWICKG